MVEEVVVVVVARVGIKYGIKRKKNGGGSRLGVQGRFGFKNPSHSVSQSP